GEGRRGADSEEVFPTGTPFARHAHQVGSRSREPGDIDRLVATVFKRGARGDQCCAGTVIELDMRIERVDKFARPVPWRAGFELQHALDDRDAVPIINRWLTDQCALAGADEGIRSIVESQQQAVRPLRANSLYANGRAGAVVPRGGVRDQILVIELDPPVGKQLRLEGESVSGGAAGKEPDLVPLDGQVLICPRAQNLEEDVRAWLPTSCVQV